MPFAEAEEDLPVVPQDEAQVVPVGQDEVENVPIALWHPEEEMRGQLTAFNF